MLVRAALLAAVLAPAGGGGPLMAAASPEPRVTGRLEADPQSGRSYVRFTLCNETDAAVAVLRWYTPFEGFFGDVFAVTREDGAAVAYRGPMAKRGDPERSSYLVLEPRECRSVSIDVSRAYSLGAGAYSVRFERGLSDVAPVGQFPRPRDRHQALPLSCGPVTLRPQR